MRKLPFLFVLLLVGCPPTFEPPPIVVPQAGSDLCGQVCAAMKNRLHPEGSDKVGCPFADGVPTEDGSIMSCTVFCQYQHQNGVSWNNSCIIDKAKTCEDVEAICNPVP